MPHFRLVTLGRIALIDDRGQMHDLGNRRRKLVLLAVLGMASRPLARDALVDMFWGEEDELRARHSLSDALSHLRRVLGPRAILARRAEVGLTPEANLSVDAVDLIAAAASGRHARTIELYQGPFLDAFYIADSRPFEDWVTHERLRFARLFQNACSSQCAELVRDERWDECAVMGQRWLDAEPTSADAALMTMTALKAVQTSEAAARALQVYQVYSDGLRSDFDAAPEPRLIALADEMIADRAADPISAVRRPPSLDAEANRAPATLDVSRHEEAATAAEFASEHLAATPVDVASKHLAATAADGASEHPAARRRFPLVARRWLYVAAAGIVAVAVVMQVRRSIWGAAPSGKQLVAIVSTRAAGADSMAWLGQGFAQMVAEDLDRAAGVEVVAPARVRALLARRGTASADIDDAEAIDVAKQLGARWAVRAVLQRKDSAYEVHIRVRDENDGAERAFTIGGASILTIAGESSARIRSVTGVVEAGPRFADIETGNVVALEHFVRSSQASEEGHYAVAVRELDAAIAADSGFTSAIVARLRIALQATEPLVIARLSGAYERAAPRLTRWDALEQAAYLALHSGEHARAEALGRQLVAAYPHDPRAYEALASTLALHGRWVAADSILRRALALDSLAMSAGRGPCAPCGAYSGEIFDQVQLGNLANAERLARRWLALQPELPAVWSSLASVLAASGQFDEAIVAERRAAQLADDDAGYLTRIGRILVMARRLGSADSLIRHWRSAGDTAVGYGIDALDLQAVLERERGQHRASVVTLRRIHDNYHDDGMLLIHANALARTGRFAAARDEYEGFPHGPRREPQSPVQSLAGDRARSFAWHHALEADALGATGDTSWLRALADSIEQIGARSYYARDWGLHHHVRGLIALRAGQPARAAHELEQARFGVAGWTRTNVELARAYSQLGNYAGALRVLRDAYQAPPDAMGRYLTRTEIDYWMARTFVAVGMLDSARVHGRYVSAAWAHADPEVRALGDSLLASIH